MVIYCRQPSSMDAALLGFRSKDFKKEEETRKYAVRSEPALGTQPTD